MRRDSACNFVSGELSKDNINNTEVPQEIDDNRAKLKDNRLEGKIVSKNVINLSQFFHLIIYQFIHSF